MATNDSTDREAKSSRPPSAAQQAKYGIWQFAGGIGAAIAGGIGFGAAATNQLHYSNAVVSSMDAIAILGALISLAALWKIRQTDQERRNEADPNQTNEQASKISGEFGYSLFALAFIAILAASLTVGIVQSTTPIWHSPGGS